MEGRRQWQGHCISGSRSMQVNAGGAARQGWSVPWNAMDRSVENGADGAGPASPKRKNIPSLQHLGLQADVAVVKAHEGSGLCGKGVCRPVNTPATDRGCGPEQHG